MNKEKQKDESSEAKYEVIVEIEDIDNMFCLGSEETISTALQKKTFKGGIYSNICFAQSDNNSLGLVKRFSLQYEEDFLSFAEAMINIPGVKNVKKDEGPWTRTWKERRAFRKEKERIQNEKEQRAKEFQKQREKDLESFKYLSEECMKKYEQRFGPGKEFVDGDWAIFKEFTTPITNCTGEFFVAFSDILAGGFMRYVHEIKEFSSVEEALSFLLICVNDNLVPFYSQVKDIHDIPFSCNYREKDGKKFVGMTIGAGKPTFVMAQYEFFIAEK
jgi:hypothetical protein